MNAPYSIEIRQNKSKMIGLTLLGLVFVALGFWLVCKPDAIARSSHYNKDFIFIVGLAGILFFGLGVIVLVRKMFDNKPGLIVSEEGVTENASFMSPGFVAWSDVEEITELKMGRQTFINLKVKNPQYYMDRQTSFWKKKLMQMNYNSFGTAIPISANTLDIDTNELKALLFEKFQEYRDGQNL